MIKPHDKLLFIGDSITHAFRKQEEIGTSYRLGAGWVMIVAAQLQAEHPDWQLTFINRGECGHGLRELAARWDADCLAVQPTVLNLLVGVNETIGHFRQRVDPPVNAFAANYRQLLDRTRQALPQVRLILCEPFLLEVGEVTAAWRTHLRDRQAVVRQLATQYGAVFVALQDAFDRAAAGTGGDYWLFDGIHPHAAGQWLISQAWRRQVLAASIAGFGSGS